jgi:hypothetical protein
MYPSRHTISAKPNDDAWDTIAMMGMGQTDDEKAEAQSTADVQAPGNHAHINNLCHVSIDDDANVVTKRHGSRRLREIPSRV